MCKYITKTAKGSRPLHGVLLSQYSVTELERGVTGLRAKGMYSGAEKCMLYCVVSKKEIVQVKEIVREVDPDAFVIVSDAREVLGEGFQEQMS